MDNVKITYSYPGCSLNFKGTPLYKLGPNRVRGFILHLEAKNPQHELLPILREYESIRLSLKKIKSFIIKHKI